MPHNQTFKAIADPTRREILKILRGGELSAGELAAHFATGRPTLSHHLAMLKETDLVSSRREGQQMIYSLNTTVVQDLLTWMWDTFSAGDEKTSRDAGRASPRKS